MATENTEVQDPLEKHQTMADFYYNEIEPQVEEEEIEEEIKSEITEEVKTEVLEEIKPEIEQVKEPVVAEEKKVWAPEFKKDADKLIYEKIMEGNEKEIYSLLNAKYAHENFTAEQKVIAFLKTKNPELDENEINFLAAEEYGIGVEPLSEDELLLLDDTQKRAIMRQGIERKKTIVAADAYFQEKADKFELPTLPNPIDLDDDYKAYKTQKEQQVTLIAQAKENEVQLFKTIDTTAQAIANIVVEDEIDLDEGKFAFKSDFKLDDKKKTQLADYAKTYVPTKDEIAAYTKNDKFDMEGYMKNLAERVFHKQIVRAAVKQALTQDRTKFIEGDLLNSNLRTNGVVQDAERVIEPWEALMGSRR